MFCYRLPCEKYRELLFVFVSQRFREYILYINTYYNIKMFILQIVFVCHGKVTNPVDSFERTIKIPAVHSAHKYVYITSYIILL